MKTIDVGTICQLRRYPVKSMGGEPLPEARLGWHGVRGDRRAALLRLDDESGLPFLSARQLPELLTYRATIPGTEETPILVVTPAGDSLRFEDPVLVSELSSLAGTPVRAIHLWRGCFDSMPISIVTTASLQALEGDLGTSLEVDRFRPNIVVELASASEAYAEDRWLGRRLTFGGGDAAQARCNRKTTRCRVVNHDTKTASANNAIHSFLATRRKNLFGVYASPEHPGVLRVGDTVRLISD
ncbi:MAG: MOSC domain-containing protein [Thermoanaerobaculia bacterium]